jgi:hypothetical protein
MGGNPGRSGETPSLVRPLRLQSVAETEVAEAVDWYRTRSPSAARGFLLELDSTLRKIHRDPDSFPLITRALRRHSSLTFPTACISGRTRK